GVLIRPAVDDVDRLDVALGGQAVDQARPALHRITRPVGGMAKLAMQLVERLSSGGVPLQSGDAFSGTRGGCFILTAAGGQEQAERDQRKRRFEHWTSGLKDRRRAASSGAVDLSSRTTRS